ncbi:MAG: hypothetical protein JW940_04465 [Polyangiaceae bacterium]|nr:hypothetical protein [Polyangiaceae bacterium]
MPGIVMVTCETCKRVTVVNPYNLQHPECPWCELFRLREENQRLRALVEGLGPADEAPGGDPRLEEQPGSTDHSST